MKRLADKVSPKALVVAWQLIHERQAECFTDSGYAWELVDLGVAKWSIPGASRHAHCVNTLRPTDRMVAEIIFLEE